MADEYKGKQAAVATRHIQTSVLIISEGRGLTKFLLSRVGSGWAG